MGGRGINRTHNMAEKIEMFAGWDWDSSVIVGRERNEHLPNRCTVVIHDDKAERVFTESEVVALVRDIMHDQTSADIANGYVNVVIGWADILRKHGVPFLDPA